MSITRVGAITCFVLTAQFLLTLAWIVLAWPDTGLPGLSDAMRGVFIEHVDQPFLFALMNFYNISFALSVTVLAIVLRDLFPDFPKRMQLVTYMALLAAAQYFASGIVPMVAAPKLAAMGDTAALNATALISEGFLLGGTMASGFAVAVFAWVSFNCGRVPFFLGILFACAAAIEIVEFTLPVFLCLDPMVGTVWSIWLGWLLWNNRLTADAPAPHSQVAGEGATT